jgi:hypothetical protein
MSTQIQRRRGTTAEHSTFTGVEGELTVDTTKDTAVVHDGTTVGGHPLQKQYPPLGSAAAPTYTFTGDTNTGIYSPGADQVAVATNGVGRLVIDSLGRLLIGETAAATSESFLTVKNGSGACELNIMSSSTSASIINLGDTGDYNIGRIKYDQSGNSLQFDTFNAERMRITSAGLVGIGTSSPDAPFHVRGAQPYASSANSLVTSVTKAAAKVTGSSDASTSLYIGVETSNANPYLQVSNATGTISDPLLLQPFGGRVGIGTQSPAQVLDVRGGVNRTPIAFKGTGSGTGYLYADNSSFGIKTSAGSLTGTDAFVGVDTANHILFLTSGTEKARIDSSGRLGIGTSSPTELLAVSGAIKYGSTGYIADGDLGFIYTGSNNNTYGTVIGTKPGTTYSTRRDFTVSLNPANGSGREVFRIEGQGGRVGIGTIPQRKFHVHEGSASDLIAQFSNATTGSSVSDGFQLQVLASDGSVVFNNRENAYTSFYTNNTERVRIDASGRLLVGTSSGVSAANKNSHLQVVGVGQESSSAQLTRLSSDNNAPSLIFGKANGPAITNIVGNGTQLGRIEFAGSDGTDIASVAAKIDVYVDGSPGANDMPGRLVFSTTADGASSPTEAFAIVDDDGNPVYQGIDQSKLVPLLTAALQEAIAKIETLEGMVAVNNITIDEQQHQLSTLAARLTALESA